MGIFNKIFGETKASETENHFWKNIESEEDLEHAIQESFSVTVVVFKHSTRCFISKTVLRNFEKEVMDSDKNISYYFLDLLAHRNLSDKIAENFGVEHQSPQLLVIENGKVVKNASHQHISLNLI